MLKNLPIIIFSCCILFTSCKEDDPIIDPPVELNTIPEFYLPATEGEYGLIQPEYTVIAGIQDNVLRPTDLDFHPMRDELWVINRGTENTGGSTVTLFKPGTAEQTKERRQDGNAWHFMSMPMSMAFSTENQNWATTAGVKDANHQGGTFTGPTLWSSDMDVYAKYHGPGTNGSHLDMLHGSPFSMGIAHDYENSFWVFDGYHEEIVFYDFADDHGPGNHDHSDGRVHRYKEVKVKRNGTIPSHMVLDKESGWLYICDNGNKRLLRMNTNSGTKKRDLPIINEPLDEHWEMEAVQWEVLETGMDLPAGIELVGNRLFVGEYNTGEIIAYDIETFEEIGRINTGAQGLSGIKAGPDGKLWFVNTMTNEVKRIEPK